MKYSIGDKVRVKSIDWYNQMLSIPNKVVWQNKLSEDYVGIWCESQIFYKDMCVYCDNIMTIRGIIEDSYYIMEEDNCGYKFTDGMIEHLVAAEGEGNRSYALGAKSHTIPSSELHKKQIEKNEPKFRKDDRVETHDGLFGYIEDIEYDGVRNCYQYYVSFIVDGGYYYEEQLKFHERNMEKIDSKLPKFKVGDKICKVGGLSNGYLVTSVSDEYYGLSLSLPDSNGVGVLPVAEQDEWVLLSEGDKKIEGIVEEANKLDTDAFSDGYNQGYDDGQHDMNEWKLPDGFEFRDENGNVIEAKKIVLEKKKKEYPKTYEECLSVLKIKGYDIVTYVPSWTEYEKALYQKVLKLRELIICRDAYWKIAGEEMGLGKPWEPGDNKVFGIIRQHDKIQKYNDFVGGSTILEFPTAEMRDAFYENFKELIEECKELL